MKEELLDILDQMEIAQSLLDLAEVAQFHLLQGIPRHLRGRYGTGGRGQGIRCRHSADRADQVAQPRRVVLVNRDDMLEVRPRLVAVEVIQ